MCIMLLVSTGQKVSVFGVILVRIFPHSNFFFSVRMRENADHNNSEYGHFSCSEASSVFCKEIPSDTLCMLDNKNSWFKLVIK